MKFDEMFDKSESFDSMFEKSWTGEVGYKGKTIPSEVASEDWEKVAPFAKSVRYRQVQERQEYPPEFYRDEQGKQILNKYGLPADVPATAERLKQIPKDKASMISQLLMPAAFNRSSIFNSG